MKTITIFADQPWNDLGCEVTAGQVVTIRVDPQDKWTDWFIESNADGNNHGIMKIPPFPALLRVKGSQEGKHAYYFTLIVTIGESLDHHFIVGTGRTFMAPVAGRLYAFANDAESAYFNNKGEIAATVELS